MEEYPSKRKLSIDGYVYLDHYVAKKPHLEVESVYLVEEKPKYYPPIYVPRETKLCRLDVDEANVTSKYKLSLINLESESESEAEAEAEPEAEPEYKYVCFIMKENGEYVKLDSIPKELHIKYPIVDPIAVLPKDSKKFSVGLAMLYIFAITYIFKMCFFAMWPEAESSFVCNIMFALLVAIMISAVVLPITMKTR